MGCEKLFGLRAIVGLVDRDEQHADALGSEVVGDLLQHGKLVLAGAATRWPKHSPSPLWRRARAPW